MDFGLRDWLLILGPIFIIGVLVHGYWRMRYGRNKLRMSLDKNFLSSKGEHLDKVEDPDEIRMLKAELPNGGARIVSKPQQQSLDLSENVPVLMEPVDVGPKREAKPATPPVSGDHGGGGEKIVALREEPAPTPPADDPPGEDEQQSPVREPERAPARRSRPEHFVVLYVTALHEPFAGRALRRSLDELGMHFGEMDIYHRLDAMGEPVFSLVNAVEPGTFDPDDMDALETPAVSLFMRAHEVAEPLQAFDAMIDAAQKLADDLAGEVKDGSRSVMTPQTIEHSRDEIREFERRYC